MEKFLMSFEKKLEDLVGFFWSLKDEEGWLWQK